MKITGTPHFLSAESKIKRADHHIKDLVRVLSGFEDSAFYRMRVERDEQSTSEKMTFEIKEELMERIAHTIGDAIHNLRAALDHVAYELVIRSGGTPNTSTKFPFGKTRQEAIAATGRVIQGVCLDLITCIVECVQPYRGGYGDALYSLHALDNIDKHRLILSILPSVGVKVVAKSDDGSVSYLGLIFARGEEAQVVESPSGAKIDGYDNLLLHIRFDEVDGFQGRPVIKTLHEVRQLTFATVKEIERAYLASRKVSYL